MKEGDKVYYISMVGHTFRTMSGIIKNIDGDWANVELRTQNSFGAIRRKRLNTLTLNKTF